MALAASARRRRADPRSPSGWKNRSWSASRQAPSNCHSHRSITGPGSREISAMVLLLSRPGTGRGRRLCLRVGMFMSSAVCLTGRCVGETLQPLQKLFKTGSRLSLVKRLLPLAQVVGECPVFRPHEVPASAWHNRAMDMSDDEPQVARAPALAVAAVA